MGKERVVLLSIGSMKLYVEVTFLSPKFFPQNTNLNSFSLKKLSNPLQNAGP